MINIIEALIPIFIGLAVLLFPIGIIVGVVLLVIYFSTEKLKRKTSMLVWSIVSILLPIIGIFALVSLWGIVNVIGEI